MPSVIARITPDDDAGVFALAFAEHLRGGLHVVFDITARDAIPADRRLEGMEVKVLVEDAKYTLTGGITNGDWVEVSIGLPDGATEDAILTFDGTDYTWTNAPIFAGTTLRGTGLGADENLPCVKFEATGQTDFSCIIRYLDSDPGQEDHSALVFADNVQGFGTARTQIDDTKGGNFLQKEHHFLNALGNRMEEINWTIMHEAGDERRVMNWTAETNGTRQSRFEFYSPLAVIVPSGQDLTGTAALYVSYAAPLAAGYAANARIYNASGTSNASWLELFGPTANWTVGTDRYASGRNNFFVWANTGDKYPIMATPNGVAINRFLADNIDPIGVLDVTGDLHLAEMGSAPAAFQAANAGAKIYVKADKLVISYLDGATMKYRALDLTGTDGLWAYGTVAP